MENKKKNIMNRAYLVALGLMFFSFLLIAKLVHIQFLEGDKYRDIASKRMLKKDILQPSSCLLYTSPSPRDATLSRMPSSA